MKMKEKVLSWSRRKHGLAQGAEIAEKALKSELFAVVATYLHLQIFERDLCVCVCVCE